MRSSLKTTRKSFSTGGANNVFVGPNKHFSIVIDEFDGKIVKAWHIENSKGRKSPNLATRSGGKHIDPRGRQGLPLHGPLHQPFLSRHV